MRQPLTNDALTDLIGVRVLDVQIIPHPFNGTALTISFDNDYQQIIWSRGVPGPDGQERVETLSVFYGPDVKPQPQPAPQAVPQPMPPYRPVAPQQPQYQVVPAPVQASVTDDPYNEYLTMLAGSGLTPQQIAAIQEYQRQAISSAQVQQQQPVQPRPTVAPDGTVLPADIYSPTFLARMGLQPR